MSELMGRGWAAELNRNHLRGCVCFLCDMTPRLPYTYEKWEERDKNSPCRYCDIRGGSHAAAMNGKAGNCSIQYVIQNATTKNLDIIREEGGWSMLYFYNPVDEDEYLAEE